MTPDVSFTHNKEGANSFVRMGSISPFLGQHISYQYGNFLDSFLDNQPDALIIPILFCYKTLHVSGIFSAHHQEFSTVHSALISIMQVFYDRFEAESGRNSVPWAEKMMMMMGREDDDDDDDDDGQRRCPKHVEFYNRIKLG